MHSISLRHWLVCVPLLAALALHAQDSRTVTEPKVPHACVALQADVASNHGVIAFADEQKLSTARIQDAIDHCAAGPAGAANAVPLIVLGKKMLKEDGIMLMKN